MRLEALQAGRRLLTAGGPGAITLTAIGAELGMTHANLIHHFGSAQGFQTALMDSMVGELAVTVTDLVERHARGELDAQTIVDQVFDAYASGGIGMLAAWMALSGNREKSDELARTVQDLVAVVETLIEGPDAADRAKEAVRLVSLLAFADSLVGKALSKRLAADRDRVRATTVQLLETLIGRPLSGG